MKLSFLLLLLIPTIAFARIGDTQDQLVQQLGRPVKVIEHSSRVKQLTFTDGASYAVVGLLDGCSVVESFFSKEGFPVSSESLTHLLASYGDKWTPLEDEEGYRAVENKEKTIVITYGATTSLDGIFFPYVVTVKNPNSMGELLYEIQHSTGGLRL